MAETTAAVPVVLVVSDLERLLPSDDPAFTGGEEDGVVWYTQPLSKKRLCIILQQSKKQVDNEIVCHVVLSKYLLYDEKIDSVDLLTTWYIRKGSLKRTRKWITDEHCLKDELDSILAEPKVNQVRVYRSGRERKNVTPTTEAESNCLLS